MSRIAFAAPQLLVHDLPASVAFYERVLGFAVEFVYDDFYAAVRRDGATIHLKCARAHEGERAHRKTNQHLDAYLDVDDVRSLHDEVVAKGATVSDRLAARPWGRLEFHVEDPDGHVLCFSQANEDPA